MKKILTISKIIFKLAHRNGTIYGMTLLVAGVASFIFTFSTGDKNLVNELQLRLQYSFAIAYSLLTLIVISAACFSIRSQIDGRQVHLLTSLPLKRYQIWLGKWLGLTLVAIVAEMALVVTLLICSAVYCRSYPFEKIRLAKEFYWVPKYKAKSTNPSLEELTKLRIQGLILDGTLDSASINTDVWKHNFNQIRKEQQLLPSNSKKTWYFDLKQKPDIGENVELRYRFYAESKRTRIQGSWLLSAAGKVEAFEQTFDVLPYTTSMMVIPVEQIPDSGQFEVTLKVDNDVDIIIGQQSGPWIFYSDGSIYHNIFKAVIAQTIHLSVSVAVGITAGVAFTFPVASFLSIVLYFISISSGIFINIVRDLTREEHVTFLSQITSWLMNSGIWLAKGLQPPEIISRISTGISIPMDQLLLNWFPATFIYAVMITLLGMAILTYKELDKIRTSS